MKVKELLSGPEKWTKGRYKQGNAYCLLGAIHHCYNNYEEVCNVKRLVRDRIIPLTGYDIIGWNDAKERTFEDVKNLVESLDI